VEVKGWRILIAESDFSLAVLMCSPKLKLRSKVSPSYLEFFTVGILTLLIKRFSVMLCLWVSVVKIYEGS
jgi:hypothetical protein